MGSSRPQKTGCEPGSTRRVAGEVPDREWPGEMLSFPAGPPLFPVLPTSPSKGELHLHK